MVLLLPRFSIADSEVSTNSYFVAFFPDFLITTNQRRLNKQTSVDATGLPKRYLFH
jgi:hypothetical protein